MVFSCKEQLIVYIHKKGVKKETRKSPTSLTQRASSFKFKIEKKVNILLSLYKTQKIQIKLIFYSK